MKRAVALYVDTELDNLKTNGTEIDNTHTGNTLLLNNILLANTFQKRLFGYMFQKKATSKGILFKPCNSLHSFFMHFDLDLYFLDQEGKLLHIEKNFSKNKNIRIKNAAQVLETPSGTLNSKNFKLGQRFYFKTSD